MNGFKQFLLRGNVVDLAVGVVIGAAFCGEEAMNTVDAFVPKKSPGEPLAAGD